MRKTPYIIAAILCVGLYHGARSAIESWSTTAASNNSAPPDGFPENMVPSAVNDSARELMAQVRRFAQQSVSATYNHDVGSANNYAINPAIAPASYISGQVFRFKANANNTGDASLNVSSLGRITIYRITNTTLSSADIRAGQIVTVVYDGTYFQMQNATIVDSAMLSANAVTLAAIAQAATGAILTWGGDRLAMTATPGTSGQVLTSRGASSTPVFSTISTTSAATKSEMEAASSQAVYAAPGTTQYHPGVAKAWASFSGNGSITVYATYAVYGITRNSAGNYSVGFASTFAAATYFNMCTQSEPSTTVGMESVRDVVRWVTGFKFGTYNSAGSPTDYDGLNCLFLGQQ